MASLVVVVAGVAARLGAHDWASVVLAMACVWVAEAVNTAIEFAVDLSSPERNPIARNAKDVAAAAVLLASMAAVVVAGFVFGPWLTGQR